MTQTFWIVEDGPSILKTQVVIGSEHDKDAWITLEFTDYFGRRYFQVFTRQDAKRLADALNEAADNKL